jgi:hypothetical protein
MVEAPGHSLPPLECRKEKKKWKMSRKERKMKVTPRFESEEEWNAEEQLRRR